MSLITDEPGANRKERKAKSYEKLSAVPKELDVALIVKAADRLANLEFCIENNNKKLLAMYKSEHAAFMRAVYRANLCEAIWSKIELIVSQ